jgi:spore germination cell wall hydrolase CwlJ-like protein
MPNTIGHQDLAALIARQPAVTERWRAHVRNSTFGTIHAASLSFPRSVGASIPDPYFTQLAALDPRALEATGSIPLNVPIDPVVAAPAYDFPVVERRLKGDRLTVKSAPEQPEPAKPSKTKDMASRMPSAEPPSDQPLPSLPGPDMASPQAAPKGNRLAPSQAEPAKAARMEIHRRAGLFAGQDTLAKRMLGTAPRPPVVVAAPAEPVADKTLRRAGIAAGQRTLAKRVLGVGPRAPATVAAMPAEQVQAPVASVEPQAPAMAAKPIRRAGLASAHIARIKREARSMREVPADTADLESQRADLAGPVVPPAAPFAAAAPAAEVAQREPTLERSVSEKPMSEDPAADVPVSEPDAQVAAIVSEPPVSVEVVPQPSPAAAAIEAAPATDFAAVHAPDETPDRLTAHVVDQLAQFAKPGAQNRIFFGTRELGIGRNEWEAWEADEVPTVLAAPHVDTEIKRAALEPVTDAESDKGGETIAPKGEVTGEGKRPRTPAERLNLVGASRGKHARCLANAIYFEARGEVERGQMAVAQVILNRAFSGYYPGNVCDVVYQNAHRHLACQFTFACDNHKDVVRDQKAWEVATRISDDALDGKFWLPEVGKATHYHATYVNPWWVRTMTKHTKLGIHIFYRPTRWGSLEDIPVWGDRLEVTGSIKRTASPASPEKKNDDKRADAQPAAPARRSIFDPVEPIDLPGG